LDTEFQYLASHREELLKLYGGKILVISGEQVSGAFDTLEQALEHAGQKHGLKDVLIWRPSDSQIEFSFVDRMAIDDAFRDMAHDKQYQREALRIVEEFGG